MERASGLTKLVAHRILPNNSVAHFQHAENGESNPKRARIGEEILDKFDPEGPNSNMQQWLHTIDELGTLHGWTPHERTGYMQANLEGKARTWFNNLVEYDFSWAEWKSKLQAAFPRYEYGKLLEILVDRRKALDETMTKYFEDKKALCERCGITGANAVSVIIRGLPKELQSHAYSYNFSNLESLYSDFLADLEDYDEWQSDKAQPEDEVRSEVSASTYKPLPKKSIRCYNCQQYGSHYMRNCPLPRVLRCMTCGEQGHSRAECPRGGHWNRFAEYSNRR